MKLEWTEQQLHELILDLRQVDWVEPTSSKTIHQKFYEILKPLFKTHNEAVKAANLDGYTEGYSKAVGQWIRGEKPDTQNEPSPNRS